MFLVDLLDDSQRLILGIDKLPTNWEFSQTPIYAPGTNYNVLTSFGNLHGKSMNFNNVNYSPLKKC